MGAEAVVDDELVVRDVSRRNRNLRVERDAGPSLFLKQGVGPAGVAAVAHEASVYARLRAAGRDVGEHVPRAVAHDPALGLLVLDLRPGAEDLWSFHRRRGSPPEVGAAVGRALGALHRSVVAEPGPPCPPPWGMTAHRPGPGDLREVTRATLELVDMIHGSPELVRRLDHLRARWRGTAFVHGDVKWNNVVVAPASDAGRPPDVLLVDWELAGAGEPPWDIGSALAAYLSVWLFSMPVPEGVSPERLPVRAGQDLSDLRPAIAACWRAYVDARRLDGADAARALAGAVEHAGARLVQTALEGSLTSPAVTVGMVLHLQVAANVLAAPTEAAVRLLGLGGDR
jgi:hypothetical protein